MNLDEDEDGFNDFRIKHGRKTHISQTDLEVFSRSTFNVRMRMTPMEDVNDLSEKLMQEEELCIAGPVIDIEDAQGFLDKCEEIKIRHNIHNWETCEKFELRLYRSTKSLCYEILDAELTADYIVVKPQKGGIETRGECGVKGKPGHNTIAMQR